MAHAVDTEQGSEGYRLVVDHGEPFEVEGVPHLPVYISGRLENSNRDMRIHALNLAVQARTSWLERRELKPEEIAGVVLDTAREFYTFLTGGDDE
jgi:hypothetical protein